MARRVRLALAALAAAIVLALALGVLVPLAPANLARTSGAGGTRTVLILSIPIHTDIALPAEPDVLRRFAFLDDAGLPAGRPGVAYVVAGWGGRRFYLETRSWSDLRPGPVVKSFTSDASVLHVQLAGPIDPAGPGVRAVTLDEPGFQALLRFVDSSLSRDIAGRPVAIEGAAYGAFDRFFEANGAFNALVGCNVWTARALREAGLATGVWTPLPALLLWSLDLHG